MLFRSRYHALDSLRAFAMFLGVLLHGGLSFMSWPSILIMDPLFRGQPVLGVLVGLPLTLAIMAVGLWVIVGGIYGWLAVIHPRNVQRLYVAIRFLASRHPIESPITRSIATGKPIDGDALADAMEVYDETNAPAPRRSWFQVLRARKVAKSAAATADLHEAQRDAYLAAERLVRVRGEERAAKEALKAAERELEKRKRSP